VANRTDRQWLFPRPRSPQEKLIKTSRHPYTIVRSTQFLEFLFSGIRRFKARMETSSGSRPSWFQAHRGPG